MPKIRLDLAKLLLKNNFLEEGHAELIKYKIHQEKKGWAICKDFNELYNRVSHTKKPPDNDNFYRHKKEMAENYVLSDIELLALMPLAIGEKTLFLLSTSQNQKILKNISFLSINMVL